MNCERTGLVLRIDNVLRPGTYDGFREIMEVVNSYGAVSVIDVTPRWHGETPTNRDYISFVREQIEANHVLALHGVEHRCRILPEDKHHASWMPTEDEFDCVEYHMSHGKDIPRRIQRRWLREGNKLLYDLFGQKTDILVPPAHAYNPNTLKAMTQEGYKIISDYGRWTPYPHIRNGILVLPTDFEDYVKLTNVDGSNSNAVFQMFRTFFDSSISQRRYYAMFVHCDFSTENDASQARLENLDRMLAYALEKEDRFVDPHIFKTQTDPDYSKFFDFKEPW